MFLQHIHPNTKIHTHKKYWGEFLTVLRILVTLKYEVPFTNSFAPSLANLKPTAKQACQNVFLNIW